MYVSRKHRHISQTHVYAHVDTHVCTPMHSRVYTHVHTNVHRHVYARAETPVYGTRVRDTCIDMRIGMPTHMCIDIQRDICMNLCAQIRGLATKTEI